MGLRTRLHTLITDYRRFRPLVEMMIATDSSLPKYPFQKQLMALQCTIAYQHARRR